MEAIRTSGCTWVVNALGKIKQKCQDSHSLFAANSLFPLHLKKRLRPDQRLIHASTDCIFSGNSGNYNINSDADPVDEYGLSKLIGECVAESGRAFVLRTSIIGPELNGHAGLMSWFLCQQGNVNGFTNHEATPQHDRAAHCPYVDQAEFPSIHWSGPKYAWKFCLVNIRTMSRSVMLGRGLRLANMNCSN